MASITIDCIEIQGITEPYLLHDLRMDITPNDHGHATLVLEIKEDGKAENLLQSLDNKMITIESKAKANTGVLFKGYVAGVTISPQIDKVMAEIRLVTATIQMDRKRESCSFQKKEAKYTEILSETAGKDGGVCTYTDDKMKPVTIGLPVIRYEESGWEFIRRLASRYWLPVIPDETADKPAFSVGMEPGGSAPAQGFFKKESAGFADMGHYIERKLKDGTGSSSMEDYSGMKVRSYHNYKIGMSADYGGKSLSICAKRAEMEQSELVFTYILGSRELYAPEPRYPEKLHGRSLTGTVVKCENERVKIQLDIDRDSGNTKTEGDLYAFPWQPDTGNLMYCMPEKDTIVTLYIGGSNEGEAIAVHSLRNGTEKDTDKPENRYLTTKDKKRMFLKPKELGYSLEDKEEGKTHFILKDGKGITFQTDQKLVVQAKGKLKIAGKEIKVEGKKEVNIRQKSAGVEIKNKVNVKGKMTYLGFGATMGEMADRAETLTLKQKPGEETEGKSTLTMTGGKPGESRGKEAVPKGKGSGQSSKKQSKEGPKYLDQVDAIAALMEEDQISKDCTFEEVYEKYGRKGGEKKYNKKEIAGAYYKYTGKTDMLDEIDYQRILKDDGRPVSQEGIDRDKEVCNHAHHICYKRGQEGEMNDIAMEGHEILRRYGIDPVLDPHNLVSAPNTGHSTPEIRKVVDGLKLTEKTALQECKEIGLTGELKDEYVKKALYNKLDKLGEAAKRKPRKKKGKVKKNDRK